MGTRSWLSDAERLKFRLLAEGLSMSSAARAQLDELRGERKLTPADYPSTTGVIPLHAQHFKRSACYRMPVGLAWNAYGTGGQDICGKSTTVSGRAVPISSQRTQERTEISPEERRWSV